MNKIIIEINEDEFRKEISDAVYESLISNIGGTSISSAREFLDDVKRKVYTIINRMPTENNF